jgi:hypothetical protein
MDSLWVTGAITLVSILALCYYAWGYLPRQMYHWHRHSLKAFARAIELRTHGRYGDSERMVQLALLVGQQLGLNAIRLQRLELAAYLRDIGMVGVPYAILNKEEPLTAIEHITFERHIEIGTSIVEQIPVLRILAPLIRQHHICYANDPNAPLEAHILSALSDLFEIAFHQDLDTALQRLQDRSGVSYHPQVVKSIESVCHPAPPAFLNAIRKTAAFW